MAERADRFVEWAAGADVYVMVELIQRDGQPHPQRRLSSALGERELRQRLLDAGVSAVDIDRLLGDAKARATADRLRGTGGAE